MAPHWRGAGQSVAELKKTIIRGGLETLYFSGLHHLMRPLVGGVGAILTLHHVRPPRSDAFQPNRLLEVSPVFLESLLRRLKRSRIDVVSLDEMHRRFISGEFKRRFVCLTFDDGYKDLLRWAYPLLRKYQMPFAALYRDQFSRPARRIVVDRARSGDRAERPHRPADRRPGSSSLNAARSTKSANSMTRSTAICAA